jgi:hypothetical protein
MLHVSGRSAPKKARQGSARGSPMSVSQQGSVRSASSLSSYRETGDLTGDEADDYAAGMAFEMVAPTAKNTAMARGRGRRLGSK